MSADGYERGFVVMCRVLEAFKMFRPIFQFPPKEIALLASIADVGKYLALNEPARVVIRESMDECDRLKLADYPTAMMLRVALEQVRIPIKWVPFEALGIPGKLVPMGHGGSA